MGAWVGLLCAQWLSRSLLGESNSWFIAPMGASAVLLFAVPSSPLAQPWSIIGGNLVSALIGVCCASVISDVDLAASLAGALAIAAMFALRCLHPPSGAVALTAVLGGPAVRSLGYHFVLWPVAINSLLLLAMALLFNNALRRRYPHRAMEHRNQHRTVDPVPSERLGLRSSDLEAVLKSRGELLDISDEDLQEIFVQAELRAYRRRFGEVLCQDIMSRDVISVPDSATVDQAWQLLSRHKIKVIPVIDEQEKLVGIVSLHDFFIVHTRPPTLLRTPQLSVNRQVRDLMTLEVTTAWPGQPMVELVGLFSDGGLHHVPVIDNEGRVLGMVTQSDVMAALFGAKLAQ